MVATTWYADGSFTGFSPTTLELDYELIHLATGGAVDVQAITRVQYKTDDAWGGSLWANGKIRVSRSDWDAAKAANPNNGITALLAIAKASDVPAVPSTNDIWTSAFWNGRIYGALNYTAAPPVGGTIDTAFPIIGPDGTVLQPNTKYWAMVLPVACNTSSPITAAIPLASFTNSQGRAVSFWTNRTPNAPVISSPPTGTVVTAGATVLLTIAATNDPDRVSGDLGAFRADRAGVQVQYAPRPTVANPTPTWTDLPFADDSNVLRKGWYISRSNANVVNEGLGWLVALGSVNITCGSPTPSAGTGFLAAGDWQIRVRTFDYGHPFPEDLQPLGLSRASGAFTASDYPATNTSPWSTPVIVTVASQVPPPIPTYPIGNSAVTLGGTVTMTWQYRNTHVPPFAQARRWVRIRRVGDSAWTDVVVNEASASASYALAGFTLVSGNQYEWQVKVQDTDGVTSDWSAVVRFWAVPRPGSGDVRPLPSSTIDGATLGCGTHRVEVYRRGGTERVGEITGISEIEWNRVRDDISTAKIVVADWGIDCGNLLAQLQCWAYELVITRDNGYSRDRVWEGPITLLTYESDTVTIHAKDVMALAYRRILKQKMTDAANGDTVTSRAARVLQNVLAPDDPNVLAYLTVVSSSGDAMQYRSTPEYSRTAFEEVDDMAANAGLDYTVVGRSIILWGTKNHIGTLPEFRDADLGNTPIVSEYGMSMANRYVVSDGNGVWGEATRLDSSGNDTTYGLVEMLSSSWASDSTPDSGTYTQEGLATIIASFEGFSERSIANRYPPPVTVRIPDNTTINPDAVISIQHLVPGVVVPLRSTSTLRTVVANQKLDSVRVIETNKVETITISLSPFSRDDDDTEGGDTE